MGVRLSVYVPCESIRGLVTLAPAAGVRHQCARSVLAIAGALLARADGGAKALGSQTLVGDIRGEY